MSLKQLTRLTICSVFVVVLQLVFSHLPHIQPLTALFMVYAAYFGFYETELLMALGLFFSSFLLGFGPWLAWQLLSFTIVIGLWYGGLVYFLGKGRKRHTLLRQLLWAGFCAVFYGLILDACLAYVYGIPVWSYLLRGFSFNIAHAVVTMVCYLVCLMVLRKNPPAAHSK
ncbi:ECF transporter S component [Streptococcus halichoeri]|uniref:ECF transporter S component n=1 Tax=Streptococcus halichoeri TaxID=254785 RepID=UPI001356F348|nr:ECF transporter S component [Streptococcus halichoeri]